MKIYVIESRSGLTDEYRFVSLYNGAKGPWRNYSQVAESDGETHQKLIETAFPSISEEK